MYKTESCINRQSIHIKHTIMFSNPTFNETCLNRTLYKKAMLYKPYGYVVETHNEYCVIDNAEKHVLSIWDWQKERNVAKTTVSFVSAKHRTHTQHIRQTSIQSNNNNKNFDNHGYRNQENEGKTDTTIGYWEQNENGKFCNVRSCITKLQ